MMCGAIVRVTRERTAKPDDDFVDISYADDVTSLRQHAAVRNTLLTRVLGDYTHLLAQTQVNVTDLEQDGDVFASHDVTQQVRWRKRKRREIRVFVSSTFRDFKEEREELTKKTFREVKRLCASSLPTCSVSNILQINKACKDRGVFFTYVDLRWGISEDQTQKGETISICLQEVYKMLQKHSNWLDERINCAMFLQIDRCRPYFICLLGERFGWSQQEADGDKALMKSFDIAIQKSPEKFGWIDDFRTGFSVTNVRGVNVTR